MMNEFPDILSNEKGYDIRNIYSFSNVTEKI
ncbi:hypothetical protein SAMN05421594_2807 [Chryseobacterium oleae]|uniref:Uncharacterized protein n=1 Tax=Chryseobacterium oleae TaxID=491207 RepID=A0A1I4Z0X0_CHROL|nr:hypothetical protein SAMN05421594_2807 [Chryseobacterium oleae]